MGRERPLSILVVDDEADICRNLADILQEFEYEADTAFSGAQALERIRQRTFDVVLLDLRMPGMDGLTLYRQLHQEHPNIVAIVISAYSNPQTTRDALSAGVVEVLSKPVDLPQLLNHLDDITSQPVVLVVDDDADLCGSLWDVLRQHRYRVGMAHTLQSARDRLHERQFEVVLVDLRLPERSGKEILRELREGGSDARCILISGHPEELDAARENQSAWGLSAVCEKPLDIPRLLEIVESFRPSLRDDG
jgi:DNA-binding NtrC family response regulator